MKRLITIFVSLIICLTVSIATVAGLTGPTENTPSVTYSFDPAKLQGLIENVEQPVRVSCNWSSSAFDSVTLKVVSADPHIATVSKGTLISCPCEPLYTSNVSSSFTVTGRFLGRTVIKVETVNATQPPQSVRGPLLTVVNDSLPVVNYHVSVVRKERFIDHLFLGLVSLMVILANVGMGCKVDLAVVKEVLTKPIAPAIGFSCQYVIMPLVCVLCVAFLLFFHFTTIQGCDNYQKLPKSTKNF